MVYPFGLRLSLSILSFLSIARKIKANTCTGPQPVFDLNGLTYSGTGPWTSSVGDIVECTLGTTTEFHQDRKAFYFDGQQSSNIKCPFEIGAVAYQTFSMHLEFYYENKSGNGWIIGHDNHGYDRSVIISDSRYGGMGQGIGGTYNPGLGEPEKNKWHQAIVVYKQDVLNGSFVVLDGIKGVTTTAINNAGESSFTIGGLENFANHGMFGHVRKVSFYDKALTDSEIATMYAESCVSSGTCDAPNGGGCLAPSFPDIYNPGGVKGDPHFKTWNGGRYDFHGVCDLVLIHNPGFKDGLGMDIHLRTKKVRQWSSVSSMAVKIGFDTFRIVAEKFEDKYWINDIEDYISSSSSNDDSILNDITLFRYPIKFRHVNKQQNEYVMDLGGSESIKISTWKSMVRVEVLNPTTKNFETSTGLMGTFHSSKWMGRDGKTIFTNPNEFGQDWQVRTNEMKLFNTYTDGTPQAPSKCEIPSKTALRRRLAQSIVTKEQAEKACASIVDNEDFDLCVFDVIASGDMEIAGAY